MFIVDFPFHALVAEEIVAVQSSAACASAHHNHNYCEHEDGCELQDDDNSKSAMHG